MITADLIAERHVAFSVSTNPELHDDGWIAVTDTDDLIRLVDDCNRGRWRRMEFRRQILAAIGIEEA